MKQRSYPQWNRLIQGFTLIEILVAICLIGILAAIVAPSIKYVGNNPLRDGTKKLSNQIRLVRTRAITETTAYRIRWAMLAQTDPQNVQTQFIVERPDQADTTQPKTCSATNWVKDPRFTTEDVTTGKQVELYGLKVNGSIPPSVLDPSPVTDAYVVCINSRGIADKNTEWNLRWRQGGGGPTQKLEVFTGGIVQVDDQI